MVTTLVTGGSGHLASALKRHFPSAIYADKQALDVGSPESVRRFFGLGRYFDVILHAGAATHHETPAKDLIRTNVLGTDLIAQQARAHGSYFIYCSTDYVYPGLSGMYTELSPCDPVNGYAWSKYAGERFAERVETHLIVRGSWYPETWRPEFAIADAFTSKIPVACAAAWIACLIEQRVTGTVNVGGPRRQLSDLVAKLNPDSRPCLRHQLVEWLPYEFPYDTSLDTRKLQRLLGHGPASGVAPQ